MGIDINELKIPKISSAIYTEGGEGNFTEDQRQTLIKLEEINDLLTASTIYVRVLAGDYAGSVAKFKIDKPTVAVFRRNWYWDQKTGGVKRFGYTVHSSWNGRLSWDKKRNNPTFRLSSDTAVILQDYAGETNLCKFDYKREAERVANHEPCNDIDNNALAVNDKVVYINLRYGCGGKLSRGRIIGLKGDPRSKSVIVMIEEDTTKQRSECRYSEQQILKV